jgi:Zn-dependent protease with chaperone function
MSRRPAMSGLALGGAGAAGWLLPGLVVAAHAALAVLAAEEFAAFGWPLPTRFDTVNVTLVLATATVGLPAVLQVARRAAAGSVALRGLLRSGRQPPPPVIHNASAELGLDGRVDVIAAREPFAVTYALVRPRILVSAALAAALSPAEITAVLAHEREHLRRRDPLRLLAARLLCGWYWYLPAARWLGRRGALRRELAADRAAVRSAGPGVLAGALLKLAATPACPAVVAARPEGAEPGSLEARVAQLEDGRPPRQRLASLRLLVTAGVLAELAVAAACCAAMSQVLPAGTL